MIDEKPKFIWSAIALAMILIYVLLFTSCKTVKEVPVEVVKERVEYIDHIQYDSIYKRDSIYIQAVGDTICIYKDKYIYKYKYLHDTTYIAQTDSVPYVIEVEKSLTKWEELKMSVGSVGIPLILILICVGIGIAVKKVI